MRNLLLKFSLAIVLSLGAFSTAYSQCTTATYGLYPSTTYTPSNCSGILESITTCAYASEYSNVNLTAGIPYTFSMSDPTCFITITDATGTIVVAFGAVAGPVSYTPATSAVYRFYRHLAGCGAATGCRNAYIQSGPAPANDLCSNAIVIGTGTVSGFVNNCATVDAVPLCGTATAPTTPGVWYSYTTGCSGQVTASLCTGTSFNTQISVFDGGCGALNCIAGNDDFCATQSEATWTGSAGTTYLILVHGNGGVGNFNLTLSQVDATAPVADVDPLSSPSSPCSVTLTPPTATDNCAGTITATTTDPTEYTTAGSYSVTWVYNDGNGNSSTQTQNLTVLPDVIPPTITCMNDTVLSNTTGVCGNVFNFDLPIATDNCNAGYPGTDVYYIRSSFSSEPWGSANNTNAMDAVFGFGNWTAEFFETMSVPAVFSTSTKLVFLEGSDGNANELNTFLSSNMAAIEAYVNAGGAILINAAPNEGGNINFGFGGTTLNYPLFCASVNGVSPAHPIFNGPFLPAGTAYTGTDFGHATVSGSGLTDLITGCSGAQLTYKNWGAGIAAFGGMTMPQYHSPAPNAQNLRQNILDWLSNSIIGGPTVTQTAGLASGSNFPLGVTTNTFTTDDGNGNSASCSFTVTVNDTEAPAPDMVNAISFSNGPISVDIEDLNTAIDSVLVSGLPTSLVSGNIGSVCIDISHSWVPDLGIFLVSPLGNIYTLSQNNGFGSNYTGTCFDMQAASSITTAFAPFTGSFIPEGFGGFDNFNGEDPNGYWKLMVDDYFFGDEGTLNSFTITFIYPEQLPDTVVECSVTLTAPTGNDNCDGAVTATTSDPLTYSTDGTYTVNWSYTDVTGNTFVQTQTVIVDDVTAPVPDVLSLSPIVDTCSVLITALPTATDNCAGALNATTTDPVSYNDAGTYTITWTYNDGRGNTSIQTQTVTVIDVDPPVPSLPILPNVVGNCVVTIPAPPTASDNCSGDLIIGTTTDPITYNLIGTFFIIWHFDDGNGNTWTQNQTVVVNPCLGIEGEDGQWEANVYPNPSSGVFTLTLAQMPTEDAQVRLVNSLGQVIYSGMLTEQNHTFDFSYLSSATYYLLISTNDNIITKPVIIRQGY